MMMIIDIFISPINVETCIQREFVSVWIHAESHGYRVRWPLYVCRRSCIQREFVTVWNQTDSIIAGVCARPLSGSAARGGAPYWDRVVKKPERQYDQKAGGMAPGPGRWSSALLSSYRSARTQEWTEDLRSDKGSRYSWGQTGLEDISRNRGKLGLET